MSFYSYGQVSGVGLSNDPYGNLNIATTSFVSPAAGADFKVTIPDVGGIWRIVALHAQIVTSATVANRVLNVNVKDHDGNIVYEFGATTVVTASLTIPITYSSLFASAVGDITAAKRFGLPIPEGPYLPGWTINSVTTAIDTTDQYSALRAWFIADQPLHDRYDYATEP